MEGLSPAVWRDYIDVGMARPVLPRFNESFCKISMGANEHYKALVPAPPFSDQGAGAGPGHVDWKFSGAVAVGTNVFFTPSYSNEIGVLDTVTSSFDYIVTGLPPWGWEYDKWIGAAAVGSMVYFAPYTFNSVGILDTVSHEFSMLQLPLGDGVGDGDVLSKYYGATAIESSIYFTPFNVDHVGVFETITSRFSMISTVSETTNVTGTEKYNGAIAIGHRIFFTPCTQTDVGVLNAVTSTFSTISIGLTALWQYKGGAAIGTTIYLAPWDADYVGVLDAETGAFYNISIFAPSLLSPLGFGSTTVDDLHWDQTVDHWRPCYTGHRCDRGAKYAGATAIGTKVYFTPYLEDNGLPTQVGTPGFTAARS